MKNEELILAKEWQSEEQSILIDYLSTGQYWKKGNSTYNESPAMEIINAVFFFGKNEDVKLLINDFIKKTAYTYMTQDEATLVINEFKKL